MAPFIFVWKCCGLEFKKDFDMKLKKLSAQFYTDFPETLYPELLLKENRTYSCLTISCKDYYICIPYRSNITRKNAFFFSKTNRSRQSKSGLDYEKIVIITDAETYFDKTEPVIDNDEYIETIIECERIAEQALKYVENYINHINGTVKMHPREFERKYKYTSLQYFHNELNI